MTPLERAERNGRIIGWLAWFAVFLAVGAAVLGACSPPITKATRSAGHEWGAWCIRQPFPERDFCRAECLRRFSAINDRRDDDCIDAVAAR